MKHTIFLLVFCIFSLNGFGQQGNVSFYKSFDEPVNKELQQEKDAIQNDNSLLGVYSPAYCPGLKGKALDLTANVPLRIPFCMDKSEHPAYGESSSFSLQIWVKSLKNAPQGTPIMTNKKTNDNKSAGWCIGTKENGSWYWNMSDGNTQYNYEPTFQRQAINDGEWHQITVSFDRSKKEIWLYFDGKNVAIYQVPNIKSMESELRTVLGGSDEYQDWGSRGEWMAFNGMIDEVRLWSKGLTAKEVSESYEQFFPTQPIAQTAPEKLKTQVWNIWHGGHRFGQNVGVERTIEILKKENADIIGLIETYGSGAIIADSLGYYFYLISTNLSIMSRYPIEETLQLFKPFNSGGALIDLGGGQKIAFFDIWLNYLPDACDLAKGESVIEEFLKKEQETRVRELTSILNDITSWTNSADRIPVLVVGDFNTDSHLDWTEENKAMHNGLAIDFPVSRLMEKADYTDSFRKLHPKAAEYPGFTWSPLINPLAKTPDCLPCRIDFIYYKGSKLLPYSSEMLNHHPVFWPSDHASVVSSFYLSQ